MVFNVICSDNFVVKMKDLMRFKPLEQIHNAEKKAPLHTTIASVEWRLWEIHAMRPRYLIKCCTDRISELDRRHRLQGNY